MRNIFSEAFDDALLYNKLLVKVVETDLAYAQKKISAKEAMKRIRLVVEDIAGLPK